MHDDEYTRRVFDELHVEPETERFFDELRERLEGGDRRALRRWRRAAIAFATAALAASVAAGVLAAQPTTTATTIDRTVQCANLAEGGSPFFDVSAQPGSPPPNANGKLPANLPTGFKPVPAIEVVSGETLTLLTTSFVVSGYQLDRTRCGASHAAPKLSAHGLPLAMTLVGQAKVVFHVRCIAPRMIVRMHLTTDSAGIPLKAQLLLLRPTGSRPLVYVDWSRSKVAAYASQSGCVSMQ